MDLRDGASDLGKSLIYAVAPQLRPSYEPLTEGYYQYGGDTTRIVEKPRDWLSYGDRLSAFAAQWAGESSVPKYLYFIENSRTVDFDDPESGHETAAWIGEALGVSAMDVFRVNSYEELCASFFQTDHHWNKEGSYAGYRAVIRLLLGEE